MHDGRITQNRLLFVRWVRKAFPDAYVAAAKRAVIPAPPGTLSGLFDNLQSTFDKFVTALPNVAQTVVNTRAQVDWLRLNSDRVKQGLPPLDPATGKAIRPDGVALPPKLRSGAEWIERALIDRTGGVPLWVWAGLVAGGLWFLLKKKR